MKQTRATLRYAKSLFNLAIEQDILEKCREDMQFVADTCASSKDLSLLLKSPIIKTDQKLSIFKEIFYNKMSEVSINFVNIITSIETISSKPQLNERTKPLNNSPLETQ